MIKKEWSFILDLINNNKKKILIGFTYIFFISLILSIVFINFHRNYLEFDLTIGKLEYVIKNEQWQNNSIINKAEEYLTGTRDTDERLILIKGIMSCLIGKISFLL